MRLLHTGLGSLAAMAMLAGAIVPAEARGRGHYGHHRHHRDNGFGFGDAVGVAALIGAAVIVANSMNKDKQSRQAGRDDAELPHGDDDRDYRADSTPDVQDMSDYALADEDAVTTACAAAVREEAGADGGYAEVRRMDTPQPIDGGWNIDGEVERRAGYRDWAGDTRRFTCTVRDGRIADVFLSRDMVSR